MSVSCYHAHKWAVVSTAVLVVIFTVIAQSSVAAAGAPKPKLTRLTTADGVEFGVLAPKPAAPAPVLFLFAADLDRTLGDPAYNRVATLLAEKGFVCVGLDAPCHGKDNTENADNPLATWRSCIEKGDDLVGDFTRKCTQVLDYLIAERYADPARVAAAGISRGGFLALHWAAAEPRVRCVAAFSPVTELMALSEFSGAKDRERIEALDLRRAAANLADRPVWIIIGNHDERVGTDRAIAFTRDVVHAAAGQKRPPLVELHVTTTPGHTTPAAAHDEAAAWVARAVARLKQG
jgi:dienelactone hydrolase